MSSPPPPALATEREIEVALAEAEAQAAEIPSLEAGAAPKVVHIPVEGPPLPRNAAPARPAESAFVAEAPEPPRAVEPPPTRHGALYAAVDVLLAALNRPFAGLSSRARQFLGLLAIATLVTSLCALLLLPAAR